MPSDAVIVDELVAIILNWCHDVLEESVGDSSVIDIIDHCRDEPLIAELRDTLTYNQLTRLVNKAMVIAQESEE